MNNICKSFFLKKMGKTWAVFFWNVWIIVDILKNKLVFQILKLSQMGQIKSKFKKSTLNQCQEIFEKNQESQRSFAEESKSSIDKL